MKKEKIMLILVPILLAIISIIAYISISSIGKDSLKFKREYESYNNKSIYDNVNYINLNISFNNPIKYSNYDEIFKVLNSETGIIFLGSPKIQDSRNIVNTLLKSVNDKKINKIYYLDITNDMDSYIVEDNKLVYELDSNGNELKGTENYHKLLEKLDNYAISYSIEYDDKVFEVPNKKVYIPTVLFVRNGTIVGAHMSTLESHESMNEKLTTEEEEELYNIFIENIELMQTEVCDINSSC